MQEKNKLSLINYINLTLEHLDASPQQIKKALQIFLTEYGIKLRSSATTLSQEINEQLNIFNNPTALESFHINNDEDFNEARIILKSCIEEFLIKIEIELYVRMNYSDKKKKLANSTLENLFKKLNTPDFLTSKFKISASDISKFQDYTSQLKKKMNEDSDDVKLNLKTISKRSANKQQQLRKTHKQPPVDSVEQVTLANSDWNSHLSALNKFNEAKTLYSEVKSYDLALEAVEQSLDFRESFHDDYREYNREQHALDLYLKGQILVAMGNQNQALDVFNEIIDDDWFIRSNALHFDILISRAKIYANLQQKKLALEECKKAELLCVSDEKLNEKFVAEKQEILSMLLPTDNNQPGFFKRRKTSPEVDLRADKDEDLSFPYTC